MTLPIPNVNPQNNTLLLPVILFCTVKLYFALGQSMRHITLTLWVWVKASNASDVQFAVCAAICDGRSHELFAEFIIINTIDKLPRTF